MGGVIFAVILGAGVALVIKAISKRDKRAETWKLTAQALGFTFHKGPHSDRPIHAHHHMPQMYGSFDGQDVYIGVRRYSTGSGKNRQTHYYTFVDVVFDIPLKRALGVRRADGVSKFFGSIFGQSDIQLGDKQFDKDFRIDGLDARQVGHLLNSGQIRAQLGADYSHKFQPSLSDTRARLEARGIIVDRAAIEPQIAAAVALYREVLAAWRELPLSQEEQVIEPGWQEIANRRGFTLDLRAMQMAGEVDGQALACEVILDDKRYLTCVRATFEPPLAVGLAMKKQGALASIAKFFGSQDVELGDPVFDKRYVIKGKDVERIKAIFNSDARDLLARLDDVPGELLVTDDFVQLTLLGPRGSLPELDDLISSIAAAAAAMIAFRRPTQLGPYR